MSTSSPDRPASETERRRITVMFADIVGFTSLVEQRGSEEAYDVITGCLKLLDGVARKHGASVDKYLGDCIMAVFGLPLAIEEAPRAALNAAIDMLRDVEAYNRERGLSSPLNVHVGINTGLAISGDVSGPVMREFAVLGDPVNVAARLKDHAPAGEVYVGEETWRYTRELFDYEALGPLKLKGKEQPVAVHRLTSRRVRASGRGPASASVFSEFVGRENLMSGLRSALTAMRAGRGAIHILVGEAGIGKTRVFDELSRAQEAEGTEWLRGAGRQIGRNVAYHIFVDVLRARLQIEEEEEPGSARAKLDEALDRLLGEGAAEAVPVVASLMGLQLDGEERARLRRIEGDAMDRVILVTMTRMLQALASDADHPLVVLLDNLHWADLASLQLLERLLRIAHETRVLFLLGARGGFEDTTGRLLGVLQEEHAGRFLRHDLEPLSHDDSRRLLRNLVGHGEVPTGFLARVEDRTRGNPFFMEEVVRSLVENATLASGAAGMDLVGPEDAELPTTVHDVIMSRIDRLAHDERSLLQAAAVVGTSVYRDVLRAVLPEVEDLEAKLASLEAAGMLRQFSERRRWEFRHPLFREVTYQSILGSRREELHRLVARAIEEHLSDSVPGFHAMLAYHWTHGRSLEDAEAHLFRAGEEASRLAAADEALRLFYDAAEFYLALNPEGGDVEKRALLERHIARAHANRAELVEAVEHTNLALEALGERVPRTTVGRALHALPGALSALRMAYRGPGRRPPASDRQRRIIELMFDRARAQITTTAAPSFVFDSLDTFRNIARVDPSSLAGVGGMLAGMVGPLAWGGVSISLSARFLAVAEPLVDPADEPESFFFETMRFIHGHVAGDWNPEHEIDPDRVSGATALGLLWDVTNYLMAFAERRIAQGRFLEAAAATKELEKIGDLFQYDLARSSALYVALILQIELGELGAALRTSDAYYTEHSEHLLNLLALGNRAKAELLAGELEGARNSLEESRAILESQRFVPPFYAVPHFRSRLLLDVLEARTTDRGSTQRARRDARHARATARRLATREPEVLRLDAQRLAFEGRQAAALQQAAASLAAAERLGAAPDQARAHAVLARLLGSSDRMVAERDSAAHETEARRLVGEEAFHWAEVEEPC